MILGAWRADNSSGGWREALVRDDRVVFLRDRKKTWAIEAPLPGESPPIVVEPFSMSVLLADGSVFRLGSDPWVARWLPFGVLDPRPTGEPAEPSPRDKNRRSNR